MSMELKLLVLDDRDPETVRTPINEAIQLLPVIDTKLLENKWRVRIGATEVVLRVEFRSKISDIVAVLDPQSEEDKAARDAWDLILLDNAWEEAGGDHQTGLNHLRQYRWKAENGPLLALYTIHSDFNADWIPEAIEAGASGVVKKNEPIHLVNLICFVLERKRRRLLQILGRREIEGILHDPLWSERIVACSPAMQTLLADIVASANYDRSIVLIEGSVGTGKSLLAELIHAISRRSQGTFFPIYIGQVHPDDFAAELFGVAPGVRPGVKPRKGLLDLTAKGTLFIDELQSALPKHLEILKSVLDRRVYHPEGAETDQRPCTTRFIFATNQPADTLVREGILSREILSRIDQIRLRAPDLSERSEDLEPLVLQAARRWRQETENPANPPEPVPATLELIRRHSFPDNVRGLLNATMKACRRVGSLETELRPEHFSELLPAAVPAATPAPAPSLTSSDYLLLARLGPRDRSSQRIIFDALVARSPDVVADDELIALVGGDKPSLQVLITRLRTRLLNENFEIVRQLNASAQGYYLTKK